MTGSLRGLKTVDASMSVSVRARRCCALSDHRGQCLRAPTDARQCCGRRQADKPQKLLGRANGPCSWTPRELTAPRTESVSSAVTRVRPERTVGGSSVSLRTSAFLRRNGETEPTVGVGGSVADAEWAISCARQRRPRCTGLARPQTTRPRPSRRIERGEVESGRGRARASSGLPIASSGRSRARQAQQSKSKPRQHFAT